MAKKKKETEGLVVINRFRHYLTLTPRAEEMVREIMEKRGQGNFSELMRSAIEHYHDEVLRSSYYHLRSQPRGLSKEAQRKMEAEQLEGQQMLICQDLDGTIKTDRDGSKTCQYFTYVGRKRYQQDVSLSYMDKGLVANQYTPSREAVEKLQKEKKTEY